MLAGVLFVGLVLSGELALAQAQDADLAALRQRVAEYWDARVKRDYCRQWDLSEPRLRAILRGPEMLVWEKEGDAPKGGVTCPGYGSSRGAIQYLGYDVGDADIKGSFASVQVKVIARITLPGSKSKQVVKTQTVPDAWIKVERVWYRRADQGDSSTPGTVPPSGTVR